MCETEIHVAGRLARARPQSHRRLGYDYEQEQFAIAVATDKAQAPPPPLRALASLFNMTLVRFGGEPPQTGLYEPLQLALHSPQIVSIRSLLRTSKSAPSRTC